MAKTVFDLLRKFNPNHEPAGSRKGGQFAPKEVAAGLAEVENSSVSPETEEWLLEMQDDPAKHIDVPFQFDWKAAQVLDHDLNVPTTSRRVYLKDLKATQPNVERAVIEHYLRRGVGKPTHEKNHNGQDAARPRVLRYQGELYIIDGHHRLGARRLAGQKTAEVAFGDIVQKFNPNHEPAGSSKGGQFAPKTTTTAEYQADAMSMFGPDVDVPGGGNRVAVEVNASPERVNTIFGSDEAMRSYLHAVTQHLPGFPGVTVEEGGSSVRVGTVLNVVINGGDGGRGRYQIVRIFTRRPNGSLDVTHDSFALSKQMQGEGLGKAISRASFQQYRTLGVDRIKTTAAMSMGGYAWARLGFKPLVNSPNEAGWPQLQGELMERLDNMSYSISPEAHTRLSSVIMRSDPRAIWDVADARAGTVNVGKALLAGTMWEGEFHMKDSEQVARMRSYLGD